MTVRLGCIDQENKELKVMISEKVFHFEGRLDEQRQMAELDMADAVTQIELLRKMLDEAEDKLKKSKPFVDTYAVSQ